MPRVTRHPYVALASGCSSSSLASSASCIWTGLPAKLLTQRKQESRTGLWSLASWFWQVLSVAGSGTAWQRPTSPTCLNLRAPLWISAQSRRPFSSLLCLSLYVNQGLDLSVWGGCSPPSAGIEVPLGESGHWNPLEGKMLRVSPSSSLSGNGSECQMGKPPGFTRRRGAQLPFAEARIPVT